MKKRTILLLILALCASFAACGTQESSPEPEDNESSSFNAIILETRDGSLLVEPVEDSAERASSDKIEVPLGDAEVYPDLKAGDLVLITHSGTIMESYPARLSEVYSVELMEPAEPEVEPLKAPPELTVTCGESSIEALKGGFSWLQGSNYAVIADSAHPLQCFELMPYLSGSGSAQLEFGVEPDELSVRRWGADCWGEPASESEDVPVSDLSIELAEGEYIYEVTAEWSRFEDFGGTASYSFYTVPAEVTRINT